MSLSNPHDHFFRATFSRPEVAAAFARQYLPPAVVEHLNLTTLQTVKDSFVDEELREHFTDLLYQVQMQDGNLAYVYLLFEHKSYPDPGVAFQLLRYMVRIWEYVRQQQVDTTLPPILPLVIYHGTARWQIATHFRDLVAAPPTFQAYVPDFRYTLYDLSAYSDAELAGAVNVQVPLWVLKHIFDAEWETVLPKLMALLNELAHIDSGLAYVETVLRYVSAAAHSLPRQALKNALEQSFPEEGGALMQTIAKEWLEEGRQQGLEQGEARGAIRATREGIFEILKTRFGTLSVPVATALADIQELPRLKTLFGQAMTVATLQEFERLLD